MTYLRGDVGGKLRLGGGRFLKFCAGRQGQALPDPELSHVGDFVHLQEIGHGDLIALGDCSQSFTFGDDVDGRRRRSRERRRLARRWFAGAAASNFSRELGGGTEAEGDLSPRAGGSGARSPGQGHRAAGIVDRASGGAPSAHRRSKRRLGIGESAALMAHGAQQSRNARARARRTIA